MGARRGQGKCNAAASSTSRTRTCVIEALECRRLRATVLWDGNADNDGGDGYRWLDRWNWSTNTWPTSADDVTIPPGHSILLEAMLEGEAHDLTCSSPLTIWNGATLRVYDDLALSSTISVYTAGTETRLAASSIAGTGTISFDGPGYNAWLLPSTPGGNVSIGPSITVKSGGESATGILGDFGSSFNNEGLILGGGLELRGTGTNEGTISVTGGNLQLEGILTNAEAFSVTGGSVSSSGTFTNNDSCSVGAGGTFTLSAGIVNGSADVNVAGTLSWTGGKFAGAATTIIESGGTLAISGAGLRWSDRPLHIDGQGVLTAGANKVLRTKSLEIDTGSLDLHDNDLIIDDTAANPLGAWNGVDYDGVTGLVRDHTIVAAGSGGESIGIATAADALGISAGEEGVWQGQTVDSDTILVGCVFAGDANLDGVIDGDDFHQIDSHAGQVGGDVSYFNGDFDYNGRVDADDYWLIDSNYNNNAPAPAPVARGAELPGVTSPLEDTESRNLLLELIDSGEEKGE